jgi:hypothetical protein
VNTYPQNALKILQLLLRCGMVCQEELNVVLEMIQAVPDRQTVAVKRSTLRRREASESQTRQNTLIPEFD